MDVLMGICATVAFIFTFIRGGIISEGEGGFGKHAVELILIIGLLACGLWLPAGNMLIVALLGAAVCMYSMAMGMQLANGAGFIGALFMFATTGPTIALYVLSLLSQS